MKDIVTAMQDLVVANRILAREGVVDAFGHVSIRHPEHPDRYLLSCSRSPELVTLDDIVEYTLDGEALDDGGRPPYAERYIHGAIYEARADVNSVVHNHSHAVIPFGVTGVRLQPLLHVGGAIGENIPVWDIADKFGDTNLLVVNMEQGRDLAACLGQAEVALMRGHGCAVVGKTVQESVMKSVYLQVSASLQLQAMQLGEIKYLSPGEIEHCSNTFVSDLAVDRAWEYLRTRAKGPSF